MTHPDDLLSDYVDDALPQGERASVDAHLSSCERCRGEVDLARAAVSALSSLEERPVPLGVTGPVLAEAARESERRRSTSQRLRWVTGLAAAAAIVAVVAVNLGRTSSLDGVGGGGAPAGATARATLAAPEVPLERQPNVNYEGAEGVRALAQDEAAAFAGSQDAIAPAPSSAPEAAAGATGAAEREADARPALRCLRAAGVALEDPDLRLARLVQARFEGTPAYFAVFLGSPGAGQPADRIVVSVVGKDACTLLNGTVLAI